MTFTSDPESPEEQPAAPRRGRRRRVLLGVGVVVVAALIWAVFIRDDSTRSVLPKVPAGSTGTTPNPASGAPDAEGSELLALLAKGRKLTFHATYKTSDATAKTSGIVSVEVWRKDGKIRQDTHASDGTETADTAGFELENGTITCSRSGTDAWTCASSPTAATGSDGLFGSETAQLAGVDVTASDATVGGQESRCFAFTTPDGNNTICITKDGLPVQLKNGGVDLTLTEASATVDDATFTPPATPTSAST